MAIPFVTASGNLNLTSKPGEIVETTELMPRRMLWWSAQIDDFICQGNGVDENVVWNGSTGTAEYPYFKPMRLPVPTVALTGATGGTGITGDYKAVYTWYDSITGMESNQCSSVSAVVSPSNQTITWTMSGTCPEWADKWRLYRSLTADYSNYYYVATIAKGTSTYADSTADASLGSAVQTTCGEMPRARYGIACNKRLFCAGVNSYPNRLHWSEIGYPFKYDSTNNYYDIGVEDGDEITGFGIIFDTLYVFKSRTIWEISGTAGNPSTWQYRNLNTGYGCAAWRTIKNCENKLYFLCEKPRAICAFDGSRADVVSDKIYNDHLENCPAYSINDSWAEYIPQYRMYQIFVNPTSGQAIALGRNRAYGFVIPTGCWYVFNYDKNMTCGTIVNLMDSVAVYAGDYSGTVRTLFNGTSFAGSAISANVKTKMFDCDKPTIIKKWTTPIIMLRSTDTHDLTVDFYVDGSTTSTGAKTAPTTRKVTRCRVDRRGYYGQVKITCATLDKKINLLGLEIPFKYKSEVK